MATAEAPPAGPEEAPLQQRFFDYFQHEIIALQEQMERLADRPLIAGERADAADHCLAGITRLSSEVKDASTYLPAYDRRTYAEAIKALQDKLNETRSTLAPKPKFSFKSARKSPSAISLSDAAELAAQKRRGVPGYLSPNSTTPDSSLSVTPAHLQTPPNEQQTTNRPVPSVPPPSTLGSNPSTNPASTTQPSRPILTSTTTSLTIHHQTSSHIILPPSAHHATTPCTASHLTRCVLSLSPSPTTTTTTLQPHRPFASLTLTHTTSSLLLCSTISGPVHITSLSNCMIVVSCRQFRMHHSSNVDVYLHCTSRPIIEDCSGIRFAELPSAYAKMLGVANKNTEHGSDGDVAESGDGGVDDVEEAGKGENMYRHVDDFKWLKSDPSPNWSVLEEEDRVKDEVWMQVLDGQNRAGVGVEEMLKEVGFGR